MTRSERALQIYLLAEAAVLLAALPAALLPTAWMAALHEAAGLGSLPQAPLVEYLTRSASWLYAGWGLLYLYVAFDAPSYWRLLRYLAATKAVFGTGMLALDVWVGMPLLWTCVEGPGIVVAAVGQYVLTRAAERAAIKR